MPRQWQLGVVETRPNTYFRTESGDVVAEGAINGIVAVVYKGTWGEPLKVVDISPEEMNNLQNIVGVGAGYRTIKQAFLGGAQLVRAVRVGVAPTTTTTNADGTKTTTAVKKPYRKLYANVTTKDADGKTVTKKVEAVKLWAKCHTSRKFTVTVNTNLFNKKRQLTIYDGTRIVESFSVTASAKESLEFTKVINAQSKCFVAGNRYKDSAGKAVGVKLNDCTALAFSTGKDLVTSVGAFADGIAALEAYDWNTIVATSSYQSVQLELANFVMQCYEVGRYGMAVIGGSSATPLEDHMALAASINDWRVVYCPSGWLGNDGVRYGGVELAGRIAGMIAGCETNASITHLVLSGAFDLLSHYTNGEYIQAEESGCLMLSKNDSGQVWIDNSINTLVTPGNDLDEGWKKIRRTKTRFELMTRVNRTCDKLIGRLNNDANGRAAIITAMTTIIREMIAEGKLFEGSYAAEDTRYTPVGDRAYFLLVIGDIDSMEKIYLTYRFSYANPFADQDVVTTTT